MSETASETWLDGIPPGVISASPDPAASQETASLGGIKVFSKPFDLVFMKPELQEATWIRVETLAGLKNVIERVATGELVPVNASSTLDRQLWGLLAEHVGFLRYKGPAGNLHDGIQPVGPEQAALVGDMSELFGGFEPAIKAIAAMREQHIESLKAKLNEGGVSAFKDDGINLTKEAEAVLAKEIYDVHTSSGLKIRMDAANAEILTRETEIENSPIGDPIAEIDAELKDLKTVTGEDAAEEGRKVERAGEGDLDD